MIFPICARSVLLTDVDDPPKQVDVTAAPDQVVAGEYRFFPDTTECSRHSMCRFPHSLMNAHWDALAFQLNAPPSYA